MLGIPDDMEDEEAFSPVKEVALPLKPQKTLITSFFKSKETDKPAPQKSKNLLGYFKKSLKTEEETIGTQVVPKSSGLNDSLNDFEEAPKKIKEVRIKQKKKASTKKREIQRKSEDKSFLAKEAKDESPPKKTNSEPQEMEISYMDFLKSQSVDEKPEENNDSAEPMEEESIMEKEEEVETGTEKDVRLTEDAETESQKPLTSTEPTSELASKEEDLTESSIEDTREEIATPKPSASSLNEKSDSTADGVKECPIEIKLTEEEKCTASSKIESKHEEDTENKPDDESKSPEEKPKPKPKGIAMFFKKVDISEKWKIREKEVFRTVTTKAVVHPEPPNRVSPVKKAANGRRRKSYKSNVSVDSHDLDLSITHLESVLIEIPEEEKEKKEGEEKETEKKDEEEEEDESDFSDAWEDVNDSRDEDEMEVEVNANSGGTNEKDDKEEKECVVIENSAEKRETPKKDGNDQSVVVSVSAEGGPSKDGDDEDDVVELTKEEIQTLKENEENQKHEIRQQNAARIASLDRVKVECNPKRRQPTLCFGAKGLVMGKVLPLEPPKDPLEENAEGKPVNVEDTQNATPVKVNKRTPRKKSVTSDEEIVITGEENPKSHKKSKSRTISEEKTSSVNDDNALTKPKKTPRKKSAPSEEEVVIMGEENPKSHKKSKSNKGSEEETLPVKGDKDSAKAKRTPRKKSVISDEVVITDEENPKSHKKSKKDSEEKTIPVKDDKDSAKPKRTPRKKLIISEEEPVVMGEEKEKSESSNLTEGKPTIEKTNKRTPRKRTVTSEDDVIVVDELTPKSQKKANPGKTKNNKAITDVGTPKEKVLTSTPLTDSKKSGRKSRARTALDSVFKSTIVSTPERTKRPALKLRLRRVKQSSTDDEFTSPKYKARQQKVNQAQKLLKRAKSSSKDVGNKKGSAKSVKTKKPSETSEEDTSQLRRSSRSSARVATLAISTSFEEKKTPKPLKLKQATKKGQEKNAKMAKKTTKKETKGKAETQTNKKTAPKKMASIFLKNKGQDNSPILIEDDEDLHPELVVDPEVLKVRKLFLMSGVPDTLRRQQASAVLTSVTYSDYPPLPTVNHIQQQSGDLVREGVDPWNLPEVSLNLRKSDNVACPASSKTWTSGVFVKVQAQEKKAVQEMQRAEPTPISEEALPYLLAEVSRSNPAYPVRRVFKQLQKAQKEQPEEKTEESNASSLPNKEKTEKTEIEEKPVKGRKRKNPEPEPAAERPTRQSKRQRGEGGSARMSLRRKSKVLEEEEDVEVVQVEPPAKEDVAEKPTAEPKVKEEQSDAGVKDVLWTEKYEPTSGNEVLGNSTCVKKLKTWLVEWKHRTDLELRRARKKILKQARRAGKSREDIKKEIKKSLGAEWWADDDSDFELDSDDEDSEFEEEDDDRLCNATVLSGPHGVGKTALVYALAKELGYKVFEVNASSRRNGKQMLAQLQEATQSHQVSKKNLDAMFTASMATEAMVTKDSPKKEKKMPTAFANFFSKGKPKEASSDAKQSAQTSGKKRPRESTKAPKAEQKTKKDKTKTADETPSKSDVSKKGLDLSSTSLVLFEEVDTIFEEDKGFWAAIQTFMSTTKRPIILTASDDKVSQQVDGRHEQLGLRTPPLINITSHLQLICLAENLRASHHDLHSLVQFYRGDLRQCLLNLQFWVQSGGSLRNVSKEPVKYHADFFKTSQTLSNTAGGMLQSPARGFSSAASQDSMSDFDITPQPKRRRCARLAIEDESSMDSVTNSPRRTPLKVVNEDSQSCMEVVIGSRSELLTAPDNLVFPPLHRACLELLTLASDLPSGILQHLQESVDRRYTERADIVSHYQAQGFNLLYSNLPSLLGLPCDLPIRRPSAALLGDQTKKRQRIKCAAELFASDDDSDSDGFVSLKKLPEKPEEPAPPKPEKKKASAEDCILMASIKSLSEMYDTFSFVDAYFHSQNELREGRCNPSGHSWSAGKVVPGLSDEGLRFMLKDDTDESLLAEAACSAQLAGVARCRGRLQKCLAKVESLPQEDRETVKEKLTLPRESPELRLASEFSMYQNLESRHRRAYQFVSSVLPHHVQLEKRAVATDYIPSLQTMCRSEQLRKSTNTKRRFLHYMDSISLPVTRKQHVLDALCSSFV